MDGGYTLSKLNKEWRLIDKGKSSGAKVANYELTDKTVVIIDEAAMASRGLLKPLLDRAKEKESKVIFVGDPSQIAAIDRGDIGRLLFDGAHSLEQVIRQCIKIT